MEVFHVKTSLVLIQEPKDSVLEKKYEELKTLFETKNYAKSLQGSFRLNEQVSSSENSILKFKINSLIAKIYRKTRDHKKAIASYKKSLNLSNSLMFSTGKSKPIVRLFNLKKLPSSIILSVIAVSPTVLYPILG